MKVFKIDPSVDEHLLAEAWEWGSDKSFEEFKQSPEHSIEYAVFLEDQLAAVLTFIRLPHAAAAYRLGLIVSPKASKRKLFRLLNLFKAEVFKYATALIVELPCEMKTARKLAAKFGFTPLTDTALILFRS